MVCSQVCRRGLSIAMLLVTLAMFPPTDCRLWELKTDSQNVTMENGVESNIDFFLTDYRSLNESIRIIVLHRLTEGAFKNKCQIEHSASGGCRPTPGPCQCVGESSGSYRYRLRMNFTEQDGGQWLFHIVNHREIHVTITVIPRPALTIFTNSQSLTVEDGETSIIDFFLNDSTAVDIGVKIVVQHKKVSGVTFDPKCRIHHSKTGGCQILFGPCECIGERSKTYQYQLRMMFTQQDGGLWKFDIVSHEGTIINITVIESITSSQAHQSTEPAQVTGLTSTIESYSLSTTTIVILIITVIVIIIIISLIAVRCHSRTHRPVIGRAGMTSYSQSLTFLCFYPCFFFVCLFVCFCLLVCYCCLFVCLGFCVCGFFFWLFFSEGVCSKRGFVLQPRLFLPVILLSSGTVGKLVTTVNRLVNCFTTREAGSEWTFCSN
ncbi:uncharacterized protein LOC112576090 isoform X1 [Pomacea canaliculata]|uniref:uncharacterized protein LOC112576090 isoform X1 n=1 Tax=Pomacea canaliculata TaxID=400727 RepID=UPI000D73F70A|nr:uncharacterized protein LOC112576090 isoform X1 [Pomacea canaliculata]